MMQARCEHLTHAFDSLQDTQGQATEVLNTAEQQLVMFEAKCNHLQDQQRAAALKAYAAPIFAVATTIACL
jgi:hypothetical protein